MAHIVARGVDQICTRLDKNELNINNLTIMHSVNAMTWLAWLPGIAALGSCATTIEAEADVDITSLLTRRGPNLDGNIEPLWMSEAFADFTLDDLGCTHGPPGKEVIDFTQECWTEAFAKFDKNGDGIISSDDVVAVGESEARSQRNLTRANLRAGLALAAQWFPEEAMQLAVHGPLVISLLVHGHKVDSLPPPAPQQFVLPGVDFSKPKPPSPVDKLALVDTYGTACVAAVIQVAVGSLGLAFGILGIPLPNGALVADLIQSKSGILDGIVGIVQKMEDLGDPKKIAMDLKDVVMFLYNKGIFKEALGAALHDMNWWKWATTVAQVGAQVALWFVPGAGQAAFLLQITVAVSHALGLVQGIRELQGACSKSYFSRKEGNASKGAMLFNLVPDIAGPPTSGM